MKAIVLAAAAATVMAGCATKPIEQMGYAEREKLVQTIMQRCTDLGLDQQSPEYPDCLKVELEREVATRRANQERFERMGQWGQQMQRNEAIAMSRHHVLVQ